LIVAPNNKLPMLISRRCFRGWGVVGRCEHICGVREKAKGERGEAASKEESERREGEEGGGGGEKEEKYTKETTV